LFARVQDAGEDLFKGGSRPQSVEGVNHAFIIRRAAVLNGEHTRRVAYAQHLLARQFHVDISGEGGEESDVFYVFLPVKRRLVQMRDAPTQGYIKVEFSTEYFRRLARVRVAPRTESRQFPTLGIHRDVAVHHG
jgi:hypothetical protein